MSLSQVSDVLSCQLGWLLQVLVPYLSGVVVESAEICGDRLVIRARACAEQAACGRCGVMSGRVHSRYGRRLAGAGIGGRAVVIRLAVRRFFCGSPDCPARTFAEQPGGLAGRYSRLSVPLRQMAGAVGLALAGRAGARLSAAMALPASRQVLLRLVMALPDPLGGPVRVLGIDDFSFRRGQSWGTLLVDVETSRPVGVLAGRDAATSTAWLQAHPGTEVICRDRAGAYAQAARDGAPQAIQVADPWHLFHNLSGYARDTVAANRAALAAAVPDPGPPPTDPAQVAAIITARHAAVQQLRAEGASLEEAAAATGLGKGRTSRYWKAGSAAELLAARGVSALDACKPYLDQRWAQGQHKIAALHAEITALGYRGSRTTTYAYASMLRLAAPPAAPPPPAIAQAACWIMAGPDRPGHRLDPAARAQLDAILAASPQLNALASHVTRFSEIANGRLGGAALDEWLDAADADDQPALHHFTRGIRQDHHAVANAVTLTWTSGKVEGHVGRLKMLKRQMYGRAGLALLRKRVLLA
jgi:transposase